MTVQPGGAGVVPPAQTASVSVLTTPDPDAPTPHTRQFGPAVPPRVVLKQGIDGDSSQWQWHQQALDGEPTALDVVLQMFTAPDSRRASRGYPRSSC